MKIEFMVIVIDGKKFVATDVPLREAQQGEGGSVQEIQLGSAYLDPADSENLFRRVDEDGIWGSDALATRIKNSLQSGGVEHILHLVQRSEPELLKFKTFGQTCLRRVKDVLADMDLCLGLRFHPEARAAELRDELKRRIAAGTA